ncbi:MAG: hypothetical protein ACFE8Z_02080 [Candidatus Hermodarchaeota archaeon]
MNSSDNEHVCENQNNARGHKQSEFNEKKVPSKTCTIVAIRGAIQYPDTASRTQETNARERLRRIRILPKEKQHGPF